MVHFGHYIQAHQIPGWETYYIGYKQLKKRIKEYAMRAAVASEDERKDILKKFSRLLDSQVEKIVLFVIERQGLLAAKLQQLRERSEVREDDEANGDRSLVINGRNKGQLMEDYRCCFHASERESTKERKEKPQEESSDECITAFFPYQETNSAWCTERL